MIFFPKKLPPDFVYSFDHNFEEISILTNDGVRLNGLLFKADSSEGLVFYLHGNAGALDTWGKSAEAYLDLNYDFFILDYRSYGKSEGKIKSEQQFHEDVRASYNLLKERYVENKIIIAGYSIGTGPAAKLASENNPQMLLLQAPYYNLTEIALSQYPFIPASLLKYKFETNRYVSETKCPVVIFHGEDDTLIPIAHSLKLQKHFKNIDKLIPLPGLGHNGMNNDANYRMALKKELHNSKSYSE